MAASRASRLAIFSCDPGGSTGLAWGVLNLTATTVVEAMQQRTHSGSATVTGKRIERMKPLDFQTAIRSQMEYIQQYWSEFVSEAYLPYYEQDGDDIELEFVLEHFVLTGGQQARHKPGVEGIYPAFLVGAIIEHFSEEDIIIQTAATGMKWNKRNYLSNYDAWIRGREHERAAFAHMAARMHVRIR